MLANDLMRMAAQLRTMREELRPAPNDPDSYALDVAGAHLLVAATQCQAAGERRAERERAAAVEAKT
jgi:hypothetical protein